MVRLCRWLLRSPRPASAAARLRLGADLLEDRVVPAGAALSQGVEAIKADLVQRLLGLDGTGITVGVISDSYDLLRGASADVASGDLPGNVGVLSEGASGTDEGRAMLQVIHDVAPGARLLFAAAGTTQTQFATSIRALANAGADVIVDDVTFPAEPMFADGIVAQAVDQVAAAGVVYFSAAGNLGRQSYQSDYRNAGTNLGTDGLGVVTGVAGFYAHDFDPGPGVDLYQTVTLPAGKTTFSFQWSDKYASAGMAGGAQTDMDLAVFDANGAFLTLVGGGFTRNTGGDPVEVFDVDAGSTGGTYKLALGKVSGPDPQLVKYVAFGSGVTIDTYATDSSTVFGHANAAGAAAVGAVRYTDTPVFGSDPPVARTFTGRGGTPILYDTAGNPQTASTRPEPRFAAPDGVDNTFFGTDDEPDGFPNFTGTSAAAPHAAGVAALLLQANRRLTPAQVYDALASTAIDVGPAGFDTDTGAGLIQALPAVLAVGGPFDVTLDGTANDDSFLVRRDDTGSNVEFVLNGQLVLSLPYAQLGSVTVTGGAGSDTLTLDYAHGAPLASAGLSYLGGESPRDDDRLVVQGYDTNLVVVNHTGPDTGTVQIGTSGPVSFAQIEPLLLDGTTADLLVNLPTGPNPDAAVGDDGGPPDPDGPTGRPGYSAVSGSTFEYTRFRNPTHALTVTLGSNGDTVALRPMDGSNTAAVTIAGGSGADTVTAVAGGGDDSVTYTPASDTGGTLTLAGGAGSTTYTLTGIDFLAADGLGQAAADAISVLAPRLTVAFAAVGGAGTITPASAAGVGWLAITYRSFEQAVVTAVTARVLGSGYDDTIGVSADGTVSVGYPGGTGQQVRVTASELDVDALSGVNHFTVAADHPFAGGVQLLAADFGNSLVVIGSGGPLTATPGLAGTVAEAGHGTIQYSGAAAVSLDAAGGPVTVNVAEGEGTTTVVLSGPDAASVRLPSGSVVAVAGSALTVTAPAATTDDRLRVSAASAADQAVTVAGGAVTLAGFLPLTAGVGVDLLDVVGGPGDDTFTVSPGTVPVSIDGGPQTTADQLVVTGSVSGRPTPGSGTITTTPTITYQNIERFALGSVPAPSPDAATVAEGGSVTIPVTDNDGGLGDGPFTVTVETPPAGGSVQVVGTSVVYTPTAGYNSGSDTDSFTYRVTDSNGDSAVGTVTVTVTPVNSAPTAFAQSVVLAANTAAAITLLADDGDPEVVQALSYTILTAPAHGTLSNFDPTAGTLTYTPAAGYDGPDSFTFAVTDDATAGGPARTSNPATAYLQVNRVNRPPVAVPDSFDVPQDGIAASPAGGVLHNDSDPDGDPLVASLVSGPAHGSLTLERTGTYTYTPVPGYHGPDSFTYAASDPHGGTATATVSITVVAPPRRYIATGAGEGGGPHVKVFDAATGEELFSFFAYDASFRGGVRVAVGDVDGDGVPDIITTPGPGGGPHVRVFSGVDLHELASFFAYDPSFRSGANVAAGDLDGDGVAEVVTGAAPGGGSRVRSFNIVDGQPVQLAGPLGSFFAFGPDFSGGVNVAVGDYDGVLGDEIICGAATEFPDVRVYGRDGRVMADFLAFDVAGVGITVAAGDVDGDGKADIVVGPGDGGGPVVRTFKGGTAELLTATVAFDEGLRGGISVAATPKQTADGRAGVVVAPTQQARSVLVLDTKRDALLNLIDAYAADFPGGVFVGAG